MLVAAAFLLAAVPDPVPIGNPGFETAGDHVLPVLWQGPSEIYSRDDSVAHTGNVSLHFRSQDASQYVLCSQPIALSPGKIYEVSAWVRTRGIQGSESGATVCIEWYDAQGKWAGGVYPSGVKGDNDWTYVHGESVRIPGDAASFSLSCYVRQGMTGEAWWDDVAVRRVHEEPLDTLLAAPNYRGEVTDAGPKKARVHVRLTLTDCDELRLRDLILRWRVLTQPEGRLVRKGSKAPKTSDYDILIPVHALKPGEYGIEIELAKRRGGEVLACRRHALRRIPARAPDAVFVDEHNRIIVDGKPFFPLGMYWGAVEQAKLDIYADSPFNCLMPYGPPNREQMDMCQAHNLKVIYSVKDFYAGTAGAPASMKSTEDELRVVKEKVDAFAAHPALLAWYINDELGLDLLDRLTQRRRDIEVMDPRHPSWVVLYQFNQVRQYVPTFDIIGTDPYPIPGQPVSLPARWTRATVEGVGGSRPVWQVPQVFNWACYREQPEEKQKCRPPTFEEMRSMAWQCIAQGANGLVLYSWFDLHRDPGTPFEQQWPQVKRMAQEIKEMSAALLSTEKSPRVEAAQADWLNWTVRRLGKTAYLIAVNNTREARQADFRLPRVPKAAALRGRGPVPLSGHRLHAEFAPLDVLIFELAL